MSTELPLSTRILLVLNPSMFNIITNGSLWGFFTPLASASLKEMSWSVRLCLKEGTVWTLFTCLWHAFLRDLNDPPMTDPQRSYLSPRLYPGGAGVDDHRSWKRIPADLCCPLEVIVIPLLHVLL